MVLWYVDIDGIHVDKCNHGRDNSDSKGYLQTHMVMMETYPTYQRIQIPLQLCFLPQEGDKISLQSTSFDVYHTKSLSLVRRAAFGVEISFETVNHFQVQVDPILVSYGSPAVCCVEETDGRSCSRMIYKGTYGLWLMG